MKHARIMRWILPLGVLLALTACRDGSGNASGTASGESVDAGPPPPPFDVTDADLDVVRLQVLVEGQPPQELRGPLPEDPIPVPVGAVLRLETWQRLQDFRVRLVTDSDRLVAYGLESGPVATRSSERPEPGGTWMALEPTEPLVAGDAYTLKIEAERGERVTDDAGRDYEDLDILLDVITPPEPGTDPEPEAESAPQETGTVSDP